MNSLRKTWLTYQKPDKSVDSIEILYVRAIKAVEIPWDIEAYLRGHSGVTIGCGMSNICYLHRDLFPHDALAIAFVKTRAYVITEVLEDGTFMAVQYAHKCNHFVELNDKARSKKFVQDHPEIFKEPIQLYPPPSHTGTTGTGPRKKQDHDFVPGRPFMPRGAYKRLLDAGLVEA
jgi:hypothetical protein